MGRKLRKITFWEGDHVKLLDSGERVLEILIALSDRTLSSIIVERASKDCYLESRGRVLF